MPLIYYAFDLLSLEETDVRDKALLERRKLLASQASKTARHLCAIAKVRIVV
jgi:ATP-dependent DNA ligase